MINNIKELQQFIIWCKQEKIKTFKNRDLEFEISELALLPETEQLKEIPLTDTSTFSDLDGMTEEEKEELLFWSSGGKSKG